MNSIFESLLLENHQLSEGVTPKKTKRSCKTESKRLIRANHIKLESRRIFEEEEFDDLDDKFDVTPEDAEESEDDEVVLVIDPEAPADEEISDEAVEDMIGDAVYKCPVCGANYLCDCDSTENESVEVDENGVPVECPICGDDSEQILIGEIAPAEGAGEEDELEPVAPDEKETDEVEEFDDEGEDFEEEDDEVIEDSLKRSRNRHIRRESKSCSRRSSKKRISESYEPFFHEGDIVKPMYDDQDERWKIVKVGTFDRLNGYEYVAEPANSIAAKSLEDDEDYEGDGKVVFYGFEVTPEANEFELAGTSRNESKSRPRRSSKRRMKEDIEDDFCPECEDDMSLTIDEPVVEDDDDAPAVEIDADNVVINLDDTRLESFMNKVIRENYKQKNASFKVTKATRRGNTLKLEYVVRSGKSRIKGTMIGEGLNLKSRRMMLKFKDKGAFTESFAKTPSFVVECIRVRNNIIPTSVRYDYKKRVNESLYRVSGKVNGLREEYFTGDYKVIYRTKYDQYRAGVNDKGEIVLTKYGYRGYEWSKPFPNLTKGRFAKLLNDNGEKFENRYWNQDAFDEVTGDGLREGKTVNPTQATRRK